MLKRTATIMLLLFALAAGIILLDVWQTSSARPASVASSTQPSAISSDVSALWILDVSSDEGGPASMVAVDPQTGAELIRLLQLYGVPKSKDGRWQYMIEAGLGGTLKLTTMDRKRGAITRISALPPTYLARGGDLITQLALSKDDRTLAVTVGGNAGIGTRWRTLVYFVDTTTGASSQRIDLFYDDAEQNRQPQVRPIFSHDGSRLFVLHDRRGQTAPLTTADAFWATDIAVVNVKERKLERVVEMPGEVQSQSLWSYGVRAPDGRLLYIMQLLTPQRDYRFVAFDTEKLQVTRTQVVPQDAGSGPFCESYSRLTPDGRYLWAFCSPDSARRGGQVHFLDTQTGLVAKQVKLERKVERTGNSDFFSARQLISPDNKLLYVVYPTTKEIFVLDLAQQTVVRNAVLSEAKPKSLNLMDAFANFLIGRASAKMAAQPAAVLSPDGERLYLTDVIDFENGNGIWAVETASLKVIGHWLKGQDITGIQLSADGRELYALGFRDHTLFALDALTGDVRRAFDKLVSQPVGFAME